MNLREYVSEVENWPKEGVQFKDITTIMDNGEAFGYAVDQIAKFAEDKDVDIIVGPEARGFIIGCPVAYRLGIGFAPVRKPNKLPRETISYEYDLEYGKNTLENANNSLNNIVIFPYNGKKILEDMNAISVEDDYKETLPRVSAAIDKMTLTDANTLFAITEDIKPPKFWGNTDRFIQQSWENNTIRRLRNGDIRFGFITVGVSPNNMEYLKEKYGYDKNNRVYLLYTLFYKTGDNMDYNKANNEFVVQFEEINKILTIFGTDFDEEYLKELYNNKTKDKQIKIEYLKRMFGINEIKVDSLRMAQL